jgi:endonuclease YncB( thermonuclease family)
MPSWISSSTISTSSSPGRGFLLAWLIGWSLLPAPVIGADDVQVRSGDMLEIDGITYCLRGIEAPEPGQTCQRANGSSFDCGHIAKTALMDLTAGAKLECDPGKITERCTIAACRADGFDLSRNMVHTGWARSLEKRFEQVEALAKRRKQGLWSGRFEPPGNWRTARP